MPPTAIAIITLVLTFGGALAGLKLRTVVPAHHLSDESRETVNRAIALVATLTALILGLVTASTKSSFDAEDAAIKDTAALLLSVDRVLARYGPETAEMRQALKQGVARRIEAFWSGSSGSGVFDPSESAIQVEQLASRLRDLTPRTENQRWLRSRAMKLSEELLDERWIIFSALTSSVPIAFLAMLLFWLTITFVSFGLFAPQNRTVVAVLFMCALSVAGAVFLVLELDGPFDGVITISPEPLNNAVARLGQ